VANELLKDCRAAMDVQTICTRSFLKSQPHPCMSGLIASLSPGRSRRKSFLTGFALTRSGTIGRVAGLGRLAINPIVRPADC
jgi:hypothetical protein